MKINNSWKLLLIGCVLCGLLKQVYTKPNTDSQKDDYDYANDDDYANYDDDESEEKSPGKQGVPNVELIETSITKHIKEGDTVQLECLRYAKNYSPISNVVFWYNDTLRLSQDKRKTVDNDRISLDDNLNVIIKNTNLYDSNTYICEIIPQNLKFQIHLHVEGKPIIKILDNSRNVLGNTITYREGNRIELQCIVVKQPDAEIKWAKAGNRLNKAFGYSFEGGKMVIDKVEPHHAGDYQCLAISSDNKTTHGVVSLLVDFAPRVTVTKPYVNTGFGYNRQLRCLYKASPPGRVIWLKDNYVINKPEKYEIINDTHNSEMRTSILIKDIQPEDIGVYTCSVTNSFGSDRGNVSLILVPEPAHFENYEIDGNHVEVEWTIRSAQPLTDILLFYQKVGEKPWIRETPVFSELNKTHGIYKVEHKLQLSPGDWYARIKSSNSEGESAISKSELIKIEEHDDLYVFEDDNEEIPRDDGKEVKKSSFFSAGDSHNPKLIHSPILITSTFFLVTILAITQRRLNA